MRQETDALIEQLQLKAHPEGGFFRETYRSPSSIAEEHLVGDFQGVRNYCTCIYFLLTSEAFSAFHRLPQDEIWHFYLGSPIQLHLITPSGEYTKITVGNNINLGQHPQFVVPGNHWFAASIEAKDGHALVGCTVAPGFDFKDFELAQREELIAVYPEWEDLIVRFTRV